MRGLRVRCAVLLACLLLPGVATAGPINWGYSTTGNSQGSYSFTGASGLMVSDAGEVRAISVSTLIGSYSAPSLVSPIPLEGPTLSSQVTLTDVESGISATFAVPIVFRDNEPAPEGEPDQHVPGLGTFATQQFTLGQHRYTVSAGPDDLFVAATAVTPEPSAILLAVVALALAGARAERFRNVWGSACM
ncbi:MAG: hypothetical protein U0792_05090 [Gemmataceae bacterium]